METAVTKTNHMINEGLLNEVPQLSLLFQQRILLVAELRYNTLDLSNLQGVMVSIWYYCK